MFQQVKERSQVSQFYYHAASKSEYSSLASKQGHIFVHSQGSTIPSPSRSGLVSRWPSTSLISYSLTNLAISSRRAFFCAGVWYQLLYRVHPVHLHSRYQCCACYSLFLKTFRVAVSTVYSQTAANLYRTIQPDNVVVPNTLKATGYVHLINLLFTYVQPGTCG